MGNLLYIILAVLSFSFINSVSVGMFTFRVCQEVYMENSAIELYIDENENSRVKCWLMNFC